MVDHLGRCLLQPNNLGTYGMIRSEIAQLRRRTVLASYNKSINGGGNIARSFQTHPHVIFSMLTCRNKRKRLSNHHWWYFKYMGTCGKLMKCWKKAEKCGAPLVVIEKKWECWTGKCDKRQKCVWNCLYLWFWEWVQF